MWDGFLNMLIGDVNESQLLVSSSLGFFFTFYINL